MTGESPTASKGDPPVQWVFAMSAFGQYLRRHLRRPTLVESLTLIAIVVVLIALVLPPVKWASTGDIQFPVRVFVFDAASGTPISDARVGIFRAPPLLGTQALAEDRDRYHPEKYVRIPESGPSTTDATGTVVVIHEFRTWGNYERPIMHAHLPWAWVHVQAAGYGGVVIPVRHESLPTAKLREQQEIFVPIGLMPDE
jgi:hypothetical protein